MAMVGTARVMPAASPYRIGSTRRRARNPLASILGEGQRWDLVSICIAIALALHVALVVFGIVAGMLRDLRLAVEDNRARLHEYFWRQYDVEAEKPKDEPKPEPPPPEPPPPEPAPALKPQAKPPEDDPYKNLPPPTPAKAGPILAVERKAEDPIELPGFANGDGGVGYGMMAGNGKGESPTMNRDATHKGVPGGGGTATAAPAAAPVEDRSRKMDLAGSRTWNCPFPPEADADQIDQAVVTVQVTVRPDGTASSAAVTSDPGHGFGRAARNCALARRYQPALDRSGTPIVGSAPVNVRFSR